MEQHTPGPWRTHEHDACHGVFDIIADSRDGLLTLCTVGMDDAPDEAPANAALIAAAPLMLAALEKTFVALGYDHDTKTGGRVYCYTCQTYGETSATLPHKERCIKRIMREAIAESRGR